VTHPTLGNVESKVSEAVERIRAHHDRSSGHVPTNTVGYCGESDGISAAYCETGVLLAALEHSENRRGDCEDALSMAERAYEQMERGEWLALALHEWKKTRTLAGCGWTFGSVIDGEVLCPCRVDADAILRLVK
jgi:hypothetical protein